MQNISLVTGGAGFIGHHLVKRLIELGDKVIIIDNLSTGRKENLHPEAIFEDCDIRDYGRVFEVFSKHKPTRVFHLAALARIQRSWDDPFNTARITFY
jgi:UDP-glucose 4-epimerase